MLSPVHHELKGSPRTAPFAVQFVDDTEPEAVDVPEGRTALQRDSGRLGKWTDRNHTGPTAADTKCSPRTSLRSQA